MHNNLSPEVNARIEAAERAQQINLRNLKAGDVLKVQTRNTLYTIRVDENGKFTIEGHKEFCPVPITAHISGSTWGGSMLKVGVLAIGMHMEFSTVHNRRIITSPIQDLTLDVAAKV